MDPDTKDRKPEDQKTSDSRQQVAAIFAALAAVAAGVDPVISLIGGDKVAFNIGLCLIIIAVATGIGIAAVAAKRAGRYQDWWRRAKPASTAASILLTLGVGIALILIAPDPPAAKTCQQTATISGAATSALAFMVQARLQCPQPVSQQAYVVVQFLNEGKKGTVKHSEYYLAWDMKNTTQAQYFSDTPSGCAERRYYVISVNQDQLTLLQQSKKTTSGAYYGEPIDTVIGKYVISNSETNHSCAST